MIAISACKTTPVQDNIGVGSGGGGREGGAAQATLEPEGAAQELFNNGQALIRQGKTQEGFATLDELDRRFGQDPRRSVQALLAQARSLRKDASDSPACKNFATTMFNQAASLGKAGNLSAAITAYKEIEQACAVGEWGAWAVFYQGDLYRQLRNHRAAIASYERLDQRFSQEFNPTVRTIVADALFKKGEILAEQGETRAAIAAYDEIDHRYAKERDVGFRLRVVRALFAKGALLGTQGTGEEPGNEFSVRSVGNTAAAIAAYDDIVQRFGRDRDPNIHNFVGRTLLKKSETLRLAGDNQGTVAVYDEIIDRFGRDDIQDSRVLVAMSLFRKGQTLGRQEGPSPAALAAFEEAIRRFGNDPYPSVRKIAEQAARARQKLIVEAAPMNDN